MDSTGPQQDKRLNRRTFVKGGLAAGGLLAAGAGLGIDRLADATEDTGHSQAPRTAAHVPAPTPKQPNILVILVDQLRYPVWFSPMGDGTALPPNLRRLRENAVSFSGH